MEQTEKMKAKEYKTGGILSLMNIKKAYASPVKQIDKERKKGICIVLRIPFLHKGLEKERSDIYNYSWLE